MDRSPDPRLHATRAQALQAALALLQEKGLLAVTHAAISNTTGISRSTLYRHWPKVDDLRNAAIARAATGPNSQARTNGPLKADLTWILGNLMTALTESPWGKIAPQVIAVAATEEQTRGLLRNWIKDRSADVESVFLAAIERGEISKEAPIPQIVEVAIAVPYFRKFVAGLQLDHDWLEAHVDMICELAVRHPNQ
ncbi:TetR/AcrR family transcriptional regulator [Ruegeria lacuscaerulensis]|uniref:TetR/AcrR family transcriptional regulator n=1 Tax=Ruegeria lacuscaerulensis TaxID=55218 RepID=UPI0023503B84|nr:TetR/AcrR family transcriptional regulator [Ruegeria lacuscaerulensis]